MYYGYDMVGVVKEEKYITIASIVDIACMKLSAICSRSLSKDYIDLYFILKEQSLKDLLVFCDIKFKIIDKAVILKSLTYFDDIEIEPIKMILEKELSMERVKEFLLSKVKWL